MFCQSPWNASDVAPPTDAILKTAGLGFHPPPSIVSEEIHQHMESIRTGQTPRRHQPRPPSEVLVAVEMARSADRRSRQSNASSPETGTVPRTPFSSGHVYANGTTQNSDYYGVVGTSLSIDGNPRHTVSPLVLPETPTRKDGTGSGDASSGPFNGYGLGNVNTRKKYVDVFNNSDVA